MGIKGIVFILTALVGVILNYTARPLSKKINIEEIKIKIAALIIVFVAVILLFVFGK